MRIGVVAQVAEVGVETIRFYERRGLIAQPPKPTQGNARQYPLATVKRIQFIRQAQNLGFSLQEIEELLRLKMTSSTNCAAVQAQASLKLIEVNQKIEKLLAIQHQLKALISACPGGDNTTQRCSILSAIDKSDVSEK